MRHVVSLIAGRKQLKHKSKLYDFPWADTEIGINDYNLILLTAWEGSMEYTLYWWKIIFTYIVYY